MGALQCGSFSGHAGERRMPSESCFGRGRTLLQSAVGGWVLCHADSCPVPLWRPRTGSFGKACGHSLSRSRHAPKAAK
eukprot:14840813-Alexandrium_andersonii.AAC.1